jgi:putative chitinase
MITASLLAQAYQIPTARAARWAPYLQLAARVAQVDQDAHRLACFLAQVGHESGRLLYTRELWGPTPQQLKYEPGTKLARGLGNTRAGDGPRYRGRGLIQVTGRLNYLATTEHLRQLFGAVGVPDFVAAPQMLEAPQWAATSAAAFWLRRGLNKWADARDFVTLTRRVNGGLNGLASRQALYSSALGALTLKGQP